MKRVYVELLFKYFTKSSAIRLLAPITLLGFTALSVEMKINFSTLYLIAKLAN